MNIRKLLIAEAEKKDILRQYGLITEAVNPEPTKTMEVDVKINFRGGYHSAVYANFKENLDPQLAKVTQFLRNGQGKAYLVTVDITASESKLPNVNYEATPAARVNPGELSKLRAKTIKDYITNKLTDYVDKKLLLALPNINVKDEGAVGPDFVGQPFCPKYLVSGDDPQGFICTESNFNPGTNEKGGKIPNWTAGKNGVYAGLLSQYRDAQKITVRLKLEELTSLKECLDGMVIELNYTNLSEAHVCNNATYNLYLTGGGQKPTNQDLLLRDGDKKNYASLDNYGSKFDNKPGTCKGDATTDASCRRYNKFTITPEMASKILEQSVSNLTSGRKPYFTIWAKCSELNGYHKKWGTGCHASANDSSSGVGDVVITNGLKEKTVFTVKTPVVRGELKPMKNINACGKQ